MIRGDYKEFMYTASLFAREDESQYSRGPWKVLGVL
jgi:hypothetical protein